MKHWPKTAWGREGFIWLFLPGLVTSLREVRAELKVGTWEIMFLLHPKTTRLGMVPPTVDCGLLHHLIIKKAPPPIDIPTGQSDLGESSLDALPCGSSRLCQVGN